MKIGDLVRIRRGDRVFPEHQGLFVIIERRRGSDWFTLYSLKTGGESLRRKRSLEVIHENR